ncbi:hypothetical protein AVEN_52621-1 [Araneus ventricosus]|uniref:Uncharacterized protein n=1 Tax=Araneus ventricosus TaxID=182803 RepID=A0A4Y2ENN5_ARAVE|nr:hypothetical protein AVEN_52621-1 [Araneus ventricosus]
MLEDAVYYACEGPMHFPPHMPIQLTGNPFYSELGVFSGVNVFETSSSSPKYSPKEFRQNISHKAPLINNRQKTLLEQLIQNFPLQLAFLRITSFLTRRY